MKVLKPLMVVTFTIMLFLLGIYIGIQIQYQETLADMKKSYNIQQTIAVVNLDIGVTKPDGSVKNYSSAIIDGLGDSYVLVSASMAESGYASGTYGAVLTFPSNLSEAIESINTKEPYSAQVEFKVNSNLPQERYISIYTELLTLQTQINESFNYMYMESIVEEFHSAQDYADALMENNNDMIEAINSVELEDYASTFEMATIPKGEFDPKPLPIENFVQQASQYSDSVSRLYLSSYAVAQKEFDEIEEAMKNSSIELNDTATIWTKDMETWANSTQSYTRNVAEYVKEVDKFHEKLSTWSDSLAEWNRQSMQYSDDMEEYKNNIDTWSNEIVSYGDELQEFCDNAEVYYSEQLINQNVDDWNTWKNKVNDIYLTEKNNAQLYENYGKEAENVMQVYEAEADKITAWATYTQNQNTYLTTWKGDLDTYYETITITDEEFAENREAYEQYIALLDEYALLMEQKDELINQKTAEINARVEALNSRIHDYNMSIGMGNELEMLDTIEVPVQLEYEIANNESVRIEAKKNLSDSKLVVDTWINGYKTLTDGVPEYAFGEIQPEIVNEIDMTNLILASEALKDVIELEELDLTVPDDIKVVIYEEEVPKMDFTAKPEYAGIEFPVDVSQEKPELAAVPPEYTVSEMPGTPEKLQEATQILVQLSESYNPENYLNEKVTGQISGIIGQYGSYLESVNRSIEANQQINIGLLTKSYSEYSLYLSELKTQIYQVHKEEQDRLTQSINRFVGDTTAIAAESESYIGVFSQKLPHTRNNSIANKQFIETAVAALEFNNGNVAIQQNVVMESDNGEKLLHAAAMCGVMLFGLVGVGIVVWIMSGKKKVELQVKEET